MKKLACLLLLALPLFADVESDLRRLTRLLGRPREWDVRVQSLRALHAAADDPLERAAIEYLLERAGRRVRRQRQPMRRRLRAIDVDRIAADVSFAVAAAQAAVAPRDLPGLANARPSRRWALVAAFLAVLVAVPLVGGLLWLVRRARRRSV